MDTLKGIGSIAILAGMIGVAAFAVFFLVTFNYGTANAGGEEQVAESTFSITVEPIEMNSWVSEGSIWRMRPGEKAMIEAIVINHSKSMDWEVQVDIQIGSPTDTHEGASIAIHARWDDGSIYHRGEIFVLRAGSERSLAIAVTALDGAGQADVYINVYRLQSNSASDSEPGGGGGESIPGLTNYNIANSH